MKFLAVIGALIGACVGTAVWAAVAYYVHLESGWIAWGVGAAVGLGGAIGGGRGFASGAMCAVLAVGAIFCGKMAAVHFSVYKLVNETVANLNESDFEVFKKDAEAFRNVPEAGYAQFMVENEYTDAPTPEDVSREEILHFKQYDMDLLVRHSQSPFTQERYRQEYRKGFERYYSNNLSLTEAVMDDLSPIDALFILFGIASAFKIGSRSEES